jgi:hypothetical protein
LATREGFVTSVTCPVLENESGQKRQLGTCRTVSESTDNGIQDANYGVTAGIIGVPIDTKKTGFGRARLFIGPPGSEQFVEIGQF